MKDRLEGWQAPVRLVRRPLEALVPAHLPVEDLWAIGASFDCLSDALRTDPNSDDEPVDDPSAGLQRDADLWHGRG